MTVGIISESDREGRAVCQSWLPGGKHNVTPTDKNSIRRESPWGLPDPPPLFPREGRRPLSSPKEKQPLWVLLSVSSRLEGRDL